MKKIKKISLALIVILMLFVSSCEKDEIYDCNCGIIIDDKIEIGTNDLIYTLTIDNYCAGDKTITVSEYTWMNNYVGDEYCE